MITLSGIWFLWIALTIICAFIIIFGLRSVLKRTSWNLSQRSRIIRVNSVVIILWMILLWVLANVGFFARFDRIPPPVTLALWLPLPFIIYVAISQWGNQLLQVVPAHVLIFIQAFRILVEILLWLTYKAGHLPIQMTFEGGNLDILTGLIALPAGYWLMKNPLDKKVAIAFNIVGMLLLINILTIAILSMPTPFRYFTSEPSNALVAKFPLIFLPGVLVPMAYGFHIFSLAKALRNSIRP